MCIRIRFFRTFVGIAEKIMLIVFSWKDSIYERMMFVSEYFFSRSRLSCRRYMCVVEITIGSNRVCFQLIQPLNVDSWIGTCNGNVI